MRMSSEEDLMVLGVPKGGLGMDAPAGRAWFHGTEMQVSVLGPDPTLAAQAVLFEHGHDVGPPQGVVWVSIEQGVSLG